jgi:hypothetical protein
VTSRRASRRDAGRLFMAEVRIIVRLGSVNSLLLLQWMSTISDNRNTYTKFDNFDIHNSFPIAYPKTTHSLMELGPS